MNKRLKAIVSLTVVTMIFSQTLIWGSYNTVKAATTDVQVAYVNSDENSLGGFKLKDKKWIDDLKCDVYIYEHAKTGAQLMFLDNKDEDKTFCINFRTPTKDSTGVNHIIEHTVLEGSKNYPVKNLFIEVAKKTLNTFLNAMTTMDSTLYPVSSKNDKDFQNLMNIYLDSVFYPNVVKDKRIFDQEGWRYELNSPDGELKYNGIVYNEMKGNYSSPDWVQIRAIAESLFPDSPYKYESGGLPEDVPNLTYENFVKTYNEFYTPSNSYIFLSGKLDIDKELKFIGENYLNNFDKKEVNTEIPLQKPFDERKIKTVEYSVPQGTDTKNKTSLSSNYVIDNIKNKNVVNGFLVLQSLLSGTPSSPLSKALKDNGFGENVSVQLNMQYFQPVLSITAKNVDESQKDKFQKVIDDTLKDIVKNGFDRNLTDAVFNSFQMYSQSVKNHSGYVYDIMAMRSWLYGGDPTSYLNMNKDIESLKGKIDSGYLQTLVQKYLLDNKHASTIVLKPSPGLEEKREKELKEKLAKYKASLSKENIDEIVKNTKALKDWQQTPNSKEDLNKIPSLTREDITNKVNEYKTVEKDENGVKVLEHSIYTNGIGYVNMYFDSSKVPQDKLGYVYLLRDILGNLDTKNYSKEKLSEEIMINSGGISFWNGYYEKYNDNNTYYPKMGVQFSSLSSNMDKNFDILKEIIYGSNLDDKKRIKEIIENMEKSKESQFMTSNVNMAIQRVNSYMTESGKYLDFNNEDLYSFLCDLDKNFDSKSDEIVKNLKEVRDIIFNKKDLIVSYTGEKENYKSFSEGFNKFSNDLRSENLKSYKYTFDSSKRNEGIVIPSKVQYVAKGGDLEKAGYTPDGKLLVLQHILQSDYLMNNLRVKGGAYGAIVSLDNSSIIFSSYRDPNLKETIDTFNNIPEYLKKFNADENEMTNYIIGAVGAFDNSDSYMKNLMGPAADGIKGDELYITGTKQSDMEKKKQEIINTKPEDIRNFSEVMDKVLKQNYLCVVGGETKIKENKNNFMAIKDLLNSKEEKGKMIELDKKDNVDSNKIWKVKFSKALDEASINTANIYVLDDKNCQIKVKISYDKDNTSINIKPESSYEKGKKYTLFIKDIQSVKESDTELKLLAPMKMDFTIVK